MHSRIQNFTHTAYLGLGSNLGDRAANLLRAISELTKHQMTVVVAASSIYETAPVDYFNQPDFLNQAIAVVTPCDDPFALLKSCIEVESRLGRIRAAPRGARTIDLDLLLFDDLVVNEARGGIELQLPHPRMQSRRFVLAPLAEIAGAVKHPVLGETILSLLKTLKEESKVSIYREQIL